MKKGFVVLETGETYEGQWLGGPDKGGEVVFNTGHSGYEEVASDPSYFGQIMVMTAPQQGNYGHHHEDWESSSLWIQGFVALEIQKSTRDSDWIDTLIKNNVPVLEGVDTRSLVLKLRDHGTPNGALVCAETAEEAQKKSKELIQKVKGLDKDWTWQVSRREPEFFSGFKKNGPRLAVLDFGVKQNTIRELQKRGSEVGVFPGRTSSKTLLDWGMDGLLLSNGPGDPQNVVGAVDTVKEILGQRTVFGICMGHQVLAQALGAKTYKLKFGHRGVNHPVKDWIQNSVYMTSQNHGYAVDEKTLPSDVVATHINLYDNSNEGIECKSKSCFSVQFHPESCPGPKEAESLFDFFVERIK